MHYLHTYSTEQSPSWEGNRFSAGQEIPAFYGTLRFITAFTRTRHLSLSWARSRHACMFHDPVSFNDEELSAPRPTTNMGDHPLSAVRDCIFSILAATLNIWRPFLHPQPENAPYRGDRNSLFWVLHPYICITAFLGVERDRRACGL